MVCYYYPFFELVISLLRELITFSVCAYREEHYCNNCGLVIIKTIILSIAEERACHF